MPAHRLLLAGLLAQLVPASPARAQQPDAVVRELAALDRATTLGDWLRVHPGDSLARYAFDPFLQEGRWCAQAVAPARRSGARRLDRRAVFYPPALADTSPRPWPALPAGPDSTLIRSGCTLGLIEVTVTRSSGDSALAPLADSVRAALIAVYGPPDTSHRVLYQAAFTWRGLARWQVAGRTVVTALAPTERPRVISFAHLPVSGLGGELGRLPQEDSTAYALEQRHDSAGFEQAVAWARRDRRVSEELRGLYLAWHDQAWIGTRPGDPRGSVAPVLRRWLAAAPRSPPAERAAALLAADRIVRLTAPSFDLNRPDDSTLASEFGRATGARYVYSELGRSDVYLGNWLEEARRAAPASPPGELALLLLLEGGFQDPVCGGEEAGEDFRTVIAEGERFLARVADPEWRARAHLAVADAYRDIVAVDAGVLEYPLGDSARHHAEAPRARQRAIEHYRAVLEPPAAADPISASRAWNEAWRLLAGLRPVETRFVCVYD